MTILDRLKGYRTVIVAGLLSIAPLWDVALQVFSALIADPDFPKLIPEGWLPAYSSISMLVMIYMRVITTTRIGGQK